MLSVIVTPNRYGSRRVEISESQVRNAIASVLGDDSPEIQVWQNVLWVRSVDCRPTFISKRQLLKTLGFA